MHRLICSAFEECTIIPQIYSTKGGAGQWLRSQNPHPHKANDIRSHRHKFRSKGDRLNHLKGLKIVNLRNNTYKTEIGFVKFEIGFVKSLTNPILMWYTMSRG